MNIENEVQRIVEDTMSRLFSDITGLLRGMRANRKEAAFGENYEANPSALYSALMLIPGVPPGDYVATISKRNPAGDGCAVMGCKRPSRSKGYCAAHYQKLRMLMKTNRAKAFGWHAPASPQSVKDVVLPRGRAGAKALKAIRSGRVSPTTGAHYGQSTRHK